MLVYRLCERGGVREEGRGKGRRGGRGYSCVLSNLALHSSQALTLEALSLNESVHLGLMVVSSQLGLGTSLLNATLKTSQVG